MKLAGFFLLALGVQQCNKTNPPEINLKQCGRYISSGETTHLCFDSVVNDSRCPANVICVWEGTAVARFQFEHNNKVYPLQLATKAVPAQYSKDTVIAGYKIEFINLLPYPGTENSSNKQVRAEVKVTKL